jgi:hypothetical protein
MWIGLLLGVIAGCGSLFGPSDEEVQKAIIAAFNGFTEVPIIQPADADQFRYSNSATLRNANADETISQEVHMVIDRANGNLAFDGVCQFDEYNDPSTGNTISGSIDYQMKGSFEGNDELAINFVFDLQYAGGAVESITFSIDETFDPVDTLPDLLVNGTSYKFKDEKLRDYVDMLRSMKVM